MVPFGGRIVNATPLSGEEVTYSSAREVWAAVHLPFHHTIRYISEKEQVLTTDPHPLFLTSDMRRDVQEIFRITPHHKQVMMFSATLAKEIRTTCKKFMTNVCSLLQ